MDSRSKRTAALLNEDSTDFWRTKMKYVAFAAPPLFSVFASANELSTDPKGLDVAKVVSVKTAQDPAYVDGRVKTKPIYVDSAGVSHNLEYTTQGYGRQNG